MKRLSGNGFTIVETLMVLAVSGVLFISSVAMVSGQQSKAQFKTSVTDITSKIQSTINEASTGYYPTGTTVFHCKVSGSKISIVGGAPTAQGQNTDCVYLGRAMMLGIPATDPQEYIIHTVVGLKKNPANPTKESVTFGDAQAVPIFLNNPGGIHRDISETHALLYGLRVLWMRGGTSDTKLAGVAFVMNPSQASYGGGGDSQLKSGSTGVSIIPIPSGSSDTGLNAANGASRITSTLRSNGPFLDSARICFTDGGDRSAIVSIGNSGGGSSVEYTIYPSKDCT